MGRARSHDRRIQKEIAAARPRARRVVRRKPGLFDCKFCGRPLYIPINIPAGVPFKLNVVVDCTKCGRPNQISIETSGS